MKQPLYYRIFLNELFSYYRRFPGSEIAGFCGLFALPRGGNVCLGGGTICLGEGITSLGEGLISPLQGVVRRGEGWTAAPNGLCGLLKSLLS